MWWLCLLGLATAEQTRTARIQTPLGALEGTVDVVSGKDVVSFLGVPFALPPTGGRRFAPPVSARAWNGTRRATELAPACQQEKDETQGDFWGATVWNANTQITEDCLYLNLWAPKDGSRLPVMVWLFGGGFWYGSPSLSLYDGKALAANGNVIVVNINYRVGPFGFLYLNHSAVPGNMGMLDQQIALKWIQANIQAFGGDPDSVTLFGESAGAASVVAHMIAPGSRALFKRGILESGALDNKWAMDSPDKAYGKAMALVEGVKCQRHTMWRTIRCLQDMSAAELSVHIWDIPLAFMEFPTVLVSKDQFFFRGNDAFLDLRDGNYARKDIMMGLNTDEGNFWNAYAMAWFSREAAPGSIPPHINFTLYEASIQIAFKDHLHLAQIYGVKQMYSQGMCNPDQKETLPDNLNFADSVNQMVGDYFFTCDMMWMADELVKEGKSNVFFYNFIQRSSTNPWPKWMGVMHGYEIEYVFGQPIVNASAYTRAETEFSRIVIDLWTSFARTGRGVPERWLPFSDRRTWYNLSDNVNTIRNIPEEKAAECKFWRSVKDAEFTTHGIVLYSYSIVSVFKNFVKY